MKTSFEKSLASAATELNKITFLKSIGYTHPSANHLERLDILLSDPVLALEKGGYDFKYTNAQLFMELCKYLNLGAELTQAYIDQVQAEALEDKQAFKPFVWIDTGFKRQNEPVAVLAFCESKRHIHFDKRFWRKSLETQLSVVREKIRDFMQTQNGEIMIWGRAKQFLFYTEKDTALVLDLEGNVTGTKAGGVPNRAVMSLN